MKRRRTTKRISFHDLFSFESRRMFIELIFVVLLQFSTIRSAPSDETRTNDTLPILMPDAVPSYVNSMNPFGGHFFPSKQNLFLERSVFVQIGQAGRRSTCFHQSEEKRCRENQLNHSAFFLFFSRFQSIGEFSRCSSHVTLRV